jgi:hypothetical protein
VFTLSISGINFDGENTTIRFSPTLQFLKLRGCPKSIFWTAPNFYDSAEGTKSQILCSFWPACGPKTAVVKDFCASGRVILEKGCPNSFLDSPEELPKNNR